MTNLSLIVKYVFMTPRCPANRLEWYRVMILSAYVSGITRAADSFFGVILNNRESNKIYLSVDIFTFLIAVLEVGNLFRDKYS